MSDYIKRDIERIIANAQECDIDALTWEEQKERLKAVKSADVAPVRHGRWKPFDRTCGRSVFTCSACGECMDVPTEMGNPLFVYCPNCGAKMDEEENDGN